jgi:hypothetical protein
MSYNCERRLTCLNKYRRVYTKTPTDPLDFECKVYQYLKCNKALLEFYNITTSEIFKQEAQSKEYKSLNWYNQINFIWYDQNGLRILGDSKSVKQKFNQSLTGYVNKLAKFKAVKQGNLTCLANSQSTSMNQTDLALLNWINFNSKTSKYLNFSQNLLPPKSIIIRILKENVENLQFVSQSSFLDRNAIHHDSVLCKVEIVHEIDRIEHILVYQSLKCFLVVTLLLILILFVKIVFPKSKKKSNSNSNSVFNESNEEISFDFKDLDISEEFNFTKTTLLINSSSLMIDKTKTPKSVIKSKTNVSVFSETGNKSIISDLFSVHALNLNKNSL